MINNFLSIYFKGAQCRVHTRQGNFNFFKVREFYVLSGKNEFVQKCQGNVREF